jgi:hypothetical protein
MDTSVPPDVVELTDLCTSLGVLEKQLKALRKKIHDQKSKPAVMEWMRRQSKSVREDAKRVPKGTKSVIAVNNMNVYVIQRPKYEKLTRQTKHRRLTEAMQVYLPNLLRHSYRDYVYQATLNKFHALSLATSCSTASSSFTAPISVSSPMSVSSSASAPSSASGIELLNGITAQMKPLVQHTVGFIEAMERRWRETNAIEEHSELLLQDIYQNSSLTSAVSTTTGSITPEHLVIRMSSSPSS